MNAKILTVFLICCAAQLPAGTLTDSANVFGPQVSMVSEHLKTVPVWIETAVATPDGGLKEFADGKVKTLTDRGFLVVITTQPRAWRISMTPTGLASSEATRLAGEAMAKEFKRGNFAEGAIAMADALTALTVKKGATDWTWVLAGCLVATLLIVFVIWVCWMLRPQRKAASGAGDARPQTRTEREQAERVFSKYSPEERRTMAYEYRRSPRYSSGVFDDPLMFYLLMESVNHPCCHEVLVSGSPVAAEPVHYSPSPSYSRAAEDDSPGSSSRSVSDFGGSSGSDWSSSNDSSSSFDSGSSSDSSGSGGGW